MAVKPHQAVLGCEVCPESMGGPGASSPGAKAPQWWCQGWTSRNNSLFPET